MDLQVIERQRQKLYKDYLRQEIEAREKARQQGSSYGRKKDQSNVNELIQKLSEEERKRLEERRNIHLQLRSHNQQLSALRRGSIRSEQKNKVDQTRNQLSTNSFVDRIDMEDLSRRTKTRLNHINNVHENQMQSHIRRNIMGQRKEVEREQEERHLATLKQQEEVRQKNHGQNVKKYDQNMQLYHLHQQLMADNDNYRRMAERFTESGEDIITKLRRNEGEDRRSAYRINQEAIRRQMEEQQLRKSQQKQLVSQGHQMENSMLRSLLHERTDHKKNYAEQLRAQMYENNYKRSQEKQVKRQRYQINGIFGGEQSRERHHQIEYVDRRLGLACSLDRSQIYNSQQSVSKASKNNLAKRDSSFSHCEKDKPELISNMQETAIIRAEENVKTSKAGLNSPQEMRQTASSAKGARQNSVKDVNKNNGEAKTNVTYPRIFGQKPNDSSQFIDLGSPKRQQQKKYFRSYDPVSNKNRFYA